MPVVVLHDADDGIVWQAIADPILGESLRLSVKAIEPGPCANPECPALVLVDSFHKVVAQAAGILRVAFIVAPFTA